jgi:predicted TIM-barrel fold metal-dependent hydrolase
MLPLIDAHAHCAGDHPDTVAVLQSLNVKILNVAFTALPHPWRLYVNRFYRDPWQSWPDRFAWITTVADPDWTDDWADSANNDLDRDFAGGAVGCKMWKNIGMRLRKADRSYLMPDDPVFQPVLAHLQKIGRPALMHLADPIASWQPLCQGQPHYDYFSRNPAWYMYGRADAPSHTQLMASRDRLVAAHPRLRVIAAHFGSLEHDLGELAKRLTAYPNLAVDTAGRLFDMVCYERRQLRQFLVTYQDRILWGTDLTCIRPHSTLPPGQRAQEQAAIQNWYQAELSFLQSEDEMVIFGRKTRGLGLAHEVVRKLVWDNARAWYPGL